jgi:TolB-like protein/Flp pilus assembly protein TadD
MALATGSRIGPYEVVAHLGSGGMGEVYRARDSRLGREVAIKVLPDSVASHPDRLARFEREAKAIAALNHPNVVTVYSIEEAEGVRFITMELVSGQSLDRLVTPGGLPLERVLELGIPLAEALVAAHERGVVHRDLKPANVMITRERRLKVLDFGLAKLAADDAALAETQAATVAAPVSTPGQVVGTVPYMAPEQLRGGEVDSRADLFSLGIMLYELAAGRRPFGGATSAEVSSAILRDPPAPLRSVRADLPGDLERIIGRCLEKDPERRFQTAKDVRNELDLVRRALESGAMGAPSPAPAAARATSEEVPSIAVLPFASRSRDEEDECFADGLADELLNVLAKIRGLRVAARTSSFQFKGGQEDLAAIGRKLNVATLLEGSLRRSGKRVRITVQLVKVADGFHLWSETYDRTLDDIFAVQDDIAQSVVKELRGTLLGAAPDSKTSGEVRAEVAAAAQGRGDNPEAHRLFLQARYFVNRLAHEDVRRGIALLHQALALEPDHALAWAYLSWAEMIIATSSNQGLVAGIARAREAASRALALGSGLAESHLAMGWIQLWYDFDWKGAEASVHRALEVAPGNVEVVRASAMVALLFGRYEEALSHCQRSLEQDPLSVVGYGVLGRVYHAMERFPEAEAAFRKTLEISPEATLMHSLLAFALDAQGRHAEAEAEVEKEAVEWARLFGQGVVYATGGRDDDSRKALERLIQIGADTAAYQIAMIHAARGEPDAAFEWLERAYAQRDSGVAFLRTHTLMRPLHPDPRWGPFVAKLGLPE